MPRGPAMTRRESPFFIGHLILIAMGLVPAIYLHCRSADGRDYRPAMMRGRRSYSASGAPNREAPPANAGGDAGTSVSTTARRPHAASGAPPPAGTGNPRFHQAGIRQSG